MYASALILAAATWSGSAHAGFDGGLAGLEVTDFAAGTHTPARGQNLVHTVTALPGTADACPGVSLDYSISNDTSFSQHSWTWVSPAFVDDTDVSVQWTYGGDHGRIFASASLDVLVTPDGESAALFGGRTLGPFLSQGVSTVTVEAGQSIQFTTKAKRRDRSNNQLMTGSVELRPLVCEATNQPPVCDGATPSIDLLWPANHTFSQVAVLGVVDPDGDDVTISIDSIYQDEEVQAHDGSGATSPDARVGTLTFLDEDDVSISLAVAELRAERAGTENGRYYHVDFTANDGQGGSCTGTVRVGVPKSQGRNGAPVDEGPIFDATAE